MLDHVIVSSLVMGEFRAHCSCGWKQQRKTKRGWLNGMHRHMDSQRAAGQQAAGQGGSGDGE